MADLEFRIIKGLTANAMFSYEIDNVEEQTHANEKSLTSRVIRNAYTTVDAAGRVKYNTPENGGMLQGQILHPPRSVELLQHFL